MPAAAMSADAEPTAPHHDSAPQQLSGHHAAHTAAVDFVTPPPPSHLSHA